MADQVKRERWVGGYWGCGVVPAVSGRVGEAAADPVSGIGTLTSSLRDSHGCGPRRVSDVRAGDKTRSQYGGNYHGRPIYSLAQASGLGRETLIDRAAHYLVLMSNSRFLAEKPVERRLIETAMNIPDRSLRTPIPSM